MPESPAGLWDQCLQSIMGKIQPQSFQTWFRDTAAARLDERKAVITVPSQFFAEWLDEHYTWLISSTIKSELGWSPTVSFTVSTQVPACEKTEADALGAVSCVPAQPPKPASNGTFRYRFDQFVVGESNGFSFSAAQAVADAPGQTAYNPLVIYGGVGLGKTHLLQAIGDHCLRRATAKRVVYVNSERFVSDYIGALKKKDVSDFVAQYRTADVLLVDDIQFYVQTEACQREFLNTFNTLYQAGKQIVISSDRPPSSLKGFEDRLVSRFQWGLVTDIAAPDLKTRIAIVTKKAEERGVQLTHDVAGLLGERVRGNVRELEGALTRLIALATFKKASFSPELVELAVAGMNQLAVEPSSITMDDIKKKTARFFNIPLESLVGATRKQEVAIARHVSMYLCKALTGAPLKAIGNQFGKRDHTTVIHACRNVDQRMETDAAFGTKVERLRGEIQSKKSD